MSVWLQRRSATDGTAFVGLAYRGVLQVHSYLPWQLMHLSNQLLAVRGVLQDLRLCLRSSIFHGTKHSLL